MRTFIVALALASSVCAEGHAQPSYGEADAVGEGLKLCSYQFGEDQPSVAMTSAARTLMWTDVSRPGVLGFEKSGPFGKIVVWAPSSPDKSLCELAVTPPAAGMAENIQDKDEMFARLSAFIRTAWPDPRTDYLRKVSEYSSVLMTRYSATDQNILIGEWEPTDTDKPVLFVSWRRQNR